MSPAPLDVQSLMDELRVLRSVVRASHPIHEKLPPAARLDIEQGEGPNEILRLAADLAGYSTFTRQRIETALSAALTFFAKLEPKPTQPRQLRPVNESETR